MFALDLKTMANIKNTDTHKLNNASVEIRTEKCIQNEASKKHGLHEEKITKELSRVNIEYMLEACKL